MGVFFKTGEGSAVGISWPVYVFFVLPFQLLYGFLKLLILGFKWLAIGIVALVSLAIAAVRSARAHEENGPPAA